MKWVVLIVRVFIGLPLVVLGLNHFLNFMPMPTPPDLPENAKAFAGVLVPTGYMDVVKVLEIAGGLLVLSGRLTPLGIVVLMPVAVNILLWDLLLIGKPGLGVLFVVLLVFLMTQYRRHFLPFFVPDAKIGGMNGYDAIVLGLGGMGSAALFELARRGRRVLGLEQYPLVHARGSSHGHTRIIRTAYYEHPDYVPLVRRAFERWHELEQLTGRHLLTACPCLTFGPVDCELIRGVGEADRKHELEVCEFTREQLESFYPPFRLPAGYIGLAEYRSGFLYVEDCVRAHLDQAKHHGAVIRAEEPVLDWAAAGGGVEVRTTAGTYHAAKLVVTAGAWATQLLRDLGVPLTVMRQVILWFEPHEPELFRRDRFPIFICDTPGGAYYGLPMIDPRGVKVARHYGAPELASPDQVTWDVTAADEAAVRGFLDEYLPGRFGRRTDGRVCMYTLTPDRHFVIDRHPRHPNVAVAAGFSGHGFKFASVVGEVLADLAETGRTELPIDMFRAGRFGG